MKTTSKARYYRLYSDMDGRDAAAEKIDRAIARAAKKHAASIRKAQGRTGLEKILWTVFFDELEETLLELEKFGAYDTACEERVMTQLKKRAREIRA